ncbi:outer membrane channel, putative [Geobacter metallireducens GS-15]|uniref:Outer membrane channel, putative n=2 Tax=Geobacter metallireducens TaxID=28232 RepID=Q39UU8_GEOMG|nr:MtrB/PioB family outer membrane beta-barrel protein [Geobacter metallireducens]ABB31976.1 outer membrane channel, putative [Geobacter metallireducens GS-15]
MIRRGYIAKFVMMVVCLWAATAVAAGSDEAVSDSGTTGQPPAVEGVTEEQTFEEPPEPPPEPPPEQPLQNMEIETHRIAEASAGYRFVGTRDSGVRAAEYDYLHSSLAGGARLTHLGKDLKLDVDGAFLNTEDYFANLMADYGGYYRLTARTESLFHNLDHVTSDLGIFDDPDRAARYGVSTRRDSIQFRYKLHDYPIHLNLSHWLIDREGTQQRRYADFSFEDYYHNILIPTEPPIVPGSKLYFRSRSVKQVSSEGTAGFDAHLGPVNVVYSFLFREFDNGESTPIHEYKALTGPSEHNEDPESRYYSHTVKLYTSPAGGITGAASYTHGRRENLSSLTSVVGAANVKDTIQNAAGDFTYSPCAWFTTAIKYRHLTIDRDTPSTLFIPSLSTQTVTLRQGIDTRKDTISANLTIRPNMLMSVNGEYQGIFQHRSNTGTTDPKTMWNLPEDSDTHKGILTVLFRPIKGFRLRGLYEYTTTNNPLYDSDPEQKHEGRLLATYTNSSRWGASANYRIAREWNDRISRTTHPELLDSPETYVLPRDRNFVHASVGFWVSPIDRFTVSGNFGYLRTRAEQAVLFATVFNGMNAATEYVSQGEIYSVNAAYHASEQLDLSLAYQLVHSRSTFKPGRTTSDGTPTDGISELSRIKTVEHSLSARADYRLMKHFGCSLDYTYRAYDNRLSSEGDGAVHEVTALLKTSW